MEPGKSSFWQYITYGDIRFHIGYSIFVPALQPPAPLPLHRFLPRPLHLRSAPPDFRPATLRFPLRSRSAHMLCLCPIFRCSPQPSAYFHDSNNSGITFDSQSHKACLTKLRNKMRRKCWTKKGRQFVDLVTLPFDLLNVSFSRMTISGDTVAECQCRKCGLHIKALLTCRTDGKGTDVNINNRTVFEQIFGYRWLCLLDINA